MYKDEFYLISGDAIEKVPYTGTDTLRFLHTDSTGKADTITYIGQGKVYDTISIGNSQINDYCSYEKYAETYSILYKADRIGYDLKFIVEGSEGSGSLNIYLLKEELDDQFSRINRISYGGYYSELKLNSKFYYQVNLFSNRGRSKTFNLYYTVKHGITRMELFHHEVWQLID